MLIPNSLHFSSLKLKKIRHQTNLLTSSSSSFYSWLTMEISFLFPKIIIKVREIFKFIFMDTKAVVSRIVSLFNQIFSKVLIIFRACCLNLEREKAIESKLLHNIKISDLLHST